MRKSGLFIASITAAIGVSCGGKTDPAPSTKDSPPPLSEDVLSNVSATRMKEVIDFLADDDQGGRVMGTLGHLASMNRIIEEMEEIGLEMILHHVN